MKIYVDGFPPGLMKGHIIKLLEYFPEPDSESGTRITMFENSTLGGTWKSRIRGITMSRNKEEFEEPVIGKVKSIDQSEGLQDVFEIEITEGVLTPDHVFVQAGQKQKGKDVIKSIFQNEVSEYIKICDPYVGIETLQMLKDVAIEKVLILTNTINNESKFLQELKTIAPSQNIQIRKISNKLHARYILTQGLGWAIDHSMKDFGSKDAFLTKLESSIDHESTFDSRWIQAVDYP